MPARGQSLTAESLRNAKLSFYLPIVVNGMILLLSALRSIPMYSGAQWGNAYIVAVAAAGFALAAPIAYLFGDSRVRIVNAIAAILIQALLLILIFASIYSGHGYEYGGALETPPEPSMWQAIYFSLVTWTTLGYGDYQPSLELQMLAGMQAVLGIVFFGLAVGLVATKIAQKERAN